MTISQRIFGIMEQKHLKQSDLANYIGVANSSVSDWKKKGSTPSADKIVKISEFLNVSVDYLLGRVDEPNETIKAVQGYVTPNKNQDTENLPNFDETTKQVAEMFSKMDIIDKSKVLSLMVELSQKKVS